MQTSIVSMITNTRTAKNKMPSAANCQRRHTNDSFITFYKSAAELEIIDRSEQRWTVDVLFGDDVFIAYRIRCVPYFFSEITSYVSSGRKTHYNSAQLIFLWSLVELLRWQSRNSKNLKFEKVRNNWSCTFSEFSTQCYHHFDRFLRFRRRE